MKFYYINDEKLMNLFLFFKQSLKSKHKFINISINDVIFLLLLMLKHSIILIGKNKFFNF